MLLPTPPQFRIRPRRPAPAARVAPPPPTPSVVVLRAEYSADGRVGWFFAAPFDDSGQGGWTPADFAALTVGGVAPDGLDEIIGADGELTLLYPLTDPPAPGLAWHVAANPAVLAFTGNRSLIVPQTGLVIIFG